MASKKGTRVHGKSVFNESWLSDEQFKMWLKKGPDEHKALCKICSTVIDNCNGKKCFNIAFQGQQAPSKCEKL